MLSVFKDLFIRGDMGQLDKFVDAVSASLAPGWVRDKKRERDLKTMMTSKDDPQYAFNYSGAKDRPPAGLFLVRKADGFTVSNIVPQQNGSLTKAQYNSILDDFADRIAKPVAERLGLSIDATAGRQPITHWVSAPTADLLQRFSGTANKGTGSAHPSDFRRWAAFLIAVHREDAELDTDTLHRWLVQEDGWPEDKASDLVLEYEFARSLLAAYDESSA